MRQTIFRHEDPDRAKYKVNAPQYRHGAREKQRAAKQEQQRQEIINQYRGFK